MSGTATAARPPFVEDFAATFEDGGACALLDVSAWGDPSHYTHNALV